LKIAFTLKPRVIRLGAASARRPSTSMFGTIAQLRSAARAGHCRH
jgi:hypothetical protein